MATTLKIKFGGSKREIEPFWVPVVVELQPYGVDKVLRFGIKDFRREVIDEPERGICYFSIPNLEEGVYTLTIRDSHMGHQIVYEPELGLQGREVEYKILEQEGDPDDVTLQPNTYGMDLMADAPYRLQKSYSYLPIMVYLKDIQPGQIKIKKIELASSPDGQNYIPLPPGSIYQVIDADGTRVEKNGQPALLRCNPGKEYETVRTDPWYRIILLYKDKLHVLQGDHLVYKGIRYLQYRVEVKYKRYFYDSKQFVFRTIVPESDFPRIDDWYYGDTHYHSEFTDNPYEYGGPLPVTAEVAKAIGLSWVTITDHSYGLSRPKTPQEEEQGNRWHSYKKAIKEVNELYKDVLLVGAEEITVRKNIAGLHLLSFNNPFVEDEHPAGFGSLTIREAFDKISESSETEGGIIYAAHPANKGYTWEDSDYKVATDIKYGHLFAGLQIFNEKILYARKTRSIDRDTLNPFEMLDERNRRRPWSEELDEGLEEHWVQRFLLPSLRHFQQDRNLRKYFILAGSDAHMDFNYSFRPHPIFLMHHLYDNAFGKARTLAYLPKKDGQALTELNLYEALRTGKTLLTDGPVIIFHLQIEGSSKIYRLGDTVTLPAEKTLRLSLEWHSTEEFGSLQEINFYLGTEQGERDITNQIDFSKLQANRFKGQITHIFPAWTASPCYLRSEATSSPETDKRLFRCLTNPIWIIMKEDFYGT